MVTSTLVQLLTRFLLILTVIAVASSSVRPHFGDVNQEEAYEDEDYYQPPAARSVLYNSDYDARDDNQDYNLLLNEIADRLTTPDDLQIYKRVANLRYPDGMYRRNGIDKKLKIKANGFTPIRCLGTSDQDTSNLVDTSGLTNEQLEQLVQRLVEYNNRIPQYPLGWERLIRGPEMKRQSRFRQCYFNPVSCFKK